MQMISSKRALDVSHSFCSDNSLDFSAQSDSVLHLMSSFLAATFFYVLEKHGGDVNH